MTTLLLIEDNPGLRKNIAEMLALEGHRVLVAADGATGIKLARADHPDLVICDIMMPGVDGYEVLAQLRAAPETAALPFIFLTAKGDAADQRVGMGLGADDYLPKPVARLDLLDAVRARLRRHEQQRRVFAPVFSNPAPLEKLGLSPREAEVLLWLAQGKSNADIASICGISLGTAKKHVLHVFEKLGVENRAAATLRALETLASAP